ncbi:hypothetical protein ABKN59_009040 [Abortiporus biennis]
MPDWSSPVELQVEAEAFLKLMHCLAGVYFFEFFISLDFDLSFITGKRQFQWPMIFYLAGRYFLLFALIGILIALDITTEINCQALYTFNQLAGNAAMGFASINLAIRTIAMWNRAKYIVIPLVLVILGHWSLILQGVLLTAEFVPGVGCSITKTNNTVLAATFIYTMSFDLTVLILTAWNLLGRQGHSQIATLLFTDGLIYFIIAFVSNFIATVFMCINLNAVMSIIFNVPAVIASTIVACRAVRRLSRFGTNTSPEVYGDIGGNSAFRAKTNNLRGQRSISFHTHTQKEPNEVHVQMETFTVADSSSIDAKRRLEDPESAM